MFRLFLLLVTVALSIGCEEEQLDFTEVKRIDERLTQRELASFLRVVKSLPSQKLPDLPPVYSPPPQWDESRTLAVSELIAAEQAAMNTRWNTETLAKAWASNLALKRILRQEKMSVEQFVGLTLALGVALNSTTLRKGQNLEEIERTGMNEINRLSKDDRPFSSLSLDGRYYILQQAVWLTRVDRARHLAMVPLENRELVEQYQEDLKLILPQQFQTNPLDEVADSLMERGIPFKLSESGEDDANLSWRTKEALIGHDSPDPEFRRGK